MKLRNLTCMLLCMMASLPSMEQITLSTATSNNGSGGVFLRLTTNTNAITVKKFNTNFSSSSGTAANVEVYTRSGDYTGFTTSNTGWTLIATVGATSAGTTGLAPIDMSAYNLEIPAGTTRSYYLHSVTTGGGIRYTGTASVPPTTTYSDANVQLVSDVARTGTAAFAGTSFNPRTFAGSIEYVIGIMPLKWLSISAKNDKDAAVISWQVDELNVNKYELQKQSTNGFISIASISSRGNGRNSYSLNDNTAFNGTASAVYRVKQTGLDGQASYSLAVTAKKQAGKNTIAAFPNPFTTYIQVTVPTKQVAIVSNSTGRTVANLQLNEGSNTVNTQNWLPGTYVIKTVTGENIKVVKQ